MEKPQTFYYTFNPLNLWLIFNVVLLVVFAYALICCPDLFYWSQTKVLIATVAFSVLAWCWKYVLKHKMAIITDDYIKIDHSAPLYWRDIASADKQTVRCGLRKCEVIALNPKEGIDYKYNFLQRHNPFPPFSIPLYGIVSNKDIEEITAIIKAKVVKTDL